MLLGTEIMGTGQCATGNWDVGQGMTDCILCVESRNQ